MLASADVALRQKLRKSLTAMRWQVREASGGAEAMAQLEDFAPEALLIDHWLPDLEVGEFAGHVSALFPGVDMLRVDGDAAAGGIRSPRRNELLQALREALAGETAAATDTSAWMAASLVVPAGRPGGLMAQAAEASGAAVTGLEAPANAARDTLPANSSGETGELPDGVLAEPEATEEAREVRAVAAAGVAIAEMIGTSAPMLELARLIRLVAPRSTAVLIEGETGSGKEVVAKALHRLSARSHKPFAVLNCAAIPEALLEAELFGHTRGAFTGAVHSRTGRIEAANGGTLFLDEIGEMPPMLQPKMLRFLECGELQRVGDNEVMQVDVRVIAATHQNLEKCCAEGTFRLDLYHRLAVFPIEVPALRERAGDIAALAEHFLAGLGKDAPRKRLSAAALRKLQQHSWPGNVRELAHVLERATILAGDARELIADDVRFRRASG